MRCLASLCIQWPRSCDVLCADLHRCAVLRLAPNVSRSFSMFQLLYLHTHLCMSWIQHSWFGALRPSVGFRIKLDICDSLYAAWVVEPRGRSCFLDHQRRRWILGQKTIHIYTISRILSSCLHPLGGQNRSRRRSMWCCLAASLRSDKKHRSSFCSAASNKRFQQVH